MTKVEKIRKYSVITFIIVGLLAIFVEKLNAPKEYNGVGDGFNGQIKVVVAANKKGSDIKIVEIKTEQTDTPGIADVAVEQLTKQILSGKNLEEIDVVAGATYTSLGFIDAVKAALSEDSEKENVKGNKDNASETVEKEEVVPVENTSSYKTYEGAGDGFNGQVKLVVSVDEAGKVAEIKAEHTDTEGLADGAIKELTKQVLSGKKLEEIDVVAGATYTSLGFLDAVKAALSKVQ